MRYAIKHKPTGKFFCEDEGGTFLVDEDDMIMTWGRKSSADEMLSEMIKYSDDGFIFVEYAGADYDMPDDNQFPVSDFEVATL